MKRRHLLQSLLLAPLAIVIPQLANSAAPNANPPAAGGSAGAAPAAAGAGAGAVPADALSEKDNMANAMKYVHNADKADPMRTDKKAFCNNCAKFNKCGAADTACKPVAKNAAWAPCEIFSGKKVANKGWCLSWSKA